MEPIINPWLIYFLEISTTLKGISIAFAMLSGMGFIAFLIVLCSRGTDSEDSYNIKEKSFVHARSKLKIFRWIFPVCLFFLIIIPSRNTLIAMYVAQKITPINVEKALKTGNSFKNEIKKDVIDIIHSIGEQQKKEK